MNLAQLSKALAAINTDSPVEFDYEQAKLGNLYTQDAFLLCKRLEFKNLLGRFDSENAQPQQQLQEFFSCSDLSGCETLFDKAAKQEYVGVSLVAEQGQVFGVGLALDSEEIYFIPVEGLLTRELSLWKASAAFTENSHGALTCSMDVKSMLKYVDGEDFGEIFDTGVAAYLLNPLKSSYTYDDIAKEYLNGRLLPSREELLGKILLEKAWQQSRRTGW